MGKNKFFTGVLIGAAVGGLVSLLDRQTRKEVVEMTKSCGTEFSRYAKHPQLVVESSKEIYEKIRTTAGQIEEDVKFINEKIEDIREITPQVKEIIDETKDTLHTSSESYKEVFTEEESEEELNRVGSEPFKGY
jgi:gas vesicle protein